MFDLENYYDKACSGKTVDNTGILSYMGHFSTVIVWGASYLGKAVVDYLMQQHIEIAEWWDARAGEIGSVKGVPVVEPFPEKSMEEKKKTLVIFCIGNTAIMPQLLGRLKENGYENVLRGDRFFMGAICPYSIETGIDGRVCNGTMTCRSMFCSRLQNIMKKRNHKGGLFLDNLTIMVTSNCSLKCKFCVAYMNSYPQEKRKFYTCEQISKDIDVVFDTVDAVGAVTVQGGEPFLHPNLDRIIARLLQKKNFGIVSIATNGIFKLDPGKLDVFRDNRLNVAFSGYYDALPKETMDIYDANVALMAANRIPHTVGVKVPEWSIPPTLWDRHYSEKIMADKKEECRAERCMQVVNGKLYPCLYSASLHEIGIADYAEDYICLEEENLKEKIDQLMNRRYYDSCGHCGGTGGTTPMAGEQGFYDFITEREDA